MKVQEIEQEETIEQEKLAKPAKRKRKPKVKKLIEKVLAIQTEVPTVLKDGRVGSQYKFASHNAILKAVRPIAISHGVLIHLSYEDFKEEGNRCSVICVLTLIDRDNPTDTIVVRCPGQGVDNQDKGPGKAQTYAKKYALMSAFLLETADEDDPDATQGPGANYRPSQDRPKTHLTRDKAGPPSDEDIGSLRQILKAEWGSAQQITKQIEKRFGPGIKTTDLSGPQVKSWLEELGGQK